MLATLSHEYRPANPVLGDVIKDLSARKKKKPSTGGGLLGSIGGSSSFAAGQQDAGGDDLDPLLVPFVTVVFEALGETAARCEDLGMMLDLVKCKPFFLKKLCLVLLERIDPARRKAKLSSLLNSFNQRYACHDLRFLYLPIFTGNKIVLLQFHFYKQYSLPTPILRL